MTGPVLALVEELSVPSIVMVLPLAIAMVAFAPDSVSVPLDCTVRLPLRVRGPPSVNVPAWLPEERVVISPALSARLYIRASSRLPPKSVVVLVPPFRASARLTAAGEG